MAPVKEIKGIARQWLAEHIAMFPGAIGAYLAGSLSYLDDEDEFPFFSDIDIRIVLDKKQASLCEHDKVTFKGYLIEWSVKYRNDFSSIEMLLSDSYSAQELVSTDILLDSNGWLRMLQKEVQEKFYLPYFVKKRCHENILKIEHAIKNPGYLTILPLAGLVLAANVRFLTIRRLLEETYIVLKEQNRLDLQELLLEVLGSRKFSEKEVRQDLDNLMAAFDYTVTLSKRPGLIGSFNLKHFVRPYIYYGTLDMVERGRHREAVWWILENYNTAARTILQSQGDKPSHFLAQHMDFLRRLELLTPEQRLEKIELSKTVLGEILKYIGSI
jgi:hypothetical protein